MVFEKMVSDGTIIPKPEVRPPTVPMDYSWAQVFFFSVHCSVSFVISDFHTL